MREKYIKVLQSQLTRDQKMESLVDLLRQNPVEEPILPGELFLDFQNDLSKRGVELRQFLNNWKVGQRCYPKANTVFCIP